MTNAGRRGPEPGGGRVARRDRPDDEPTWTPDVADDESSRALPRRASPVVRSTDWTHCSAAAAGESVVRGLPAPANGFRGRNEAVAGRRRKMRATKRTMAEARLYSSARGTEMIEIGTARACKRGE